MRKLPIGIQNFKELRTENYYYVDKTLFVKQLVEGGKYYFFTEPGGKALEQIKKKKYEEKYHGRYEEINSKIILSSEL